MQVIRRAETFANKYMVRYREPPSQTWCTFLENHVSQLVSIDFSTVPTIRFHVLYLFLVLAHDRRGILLLLLRFLDNFDSVPFRIVNLKIAGSLPILLNGANIDSSCGQHFFHSADALRKQH